AASGSRPAPVAPGTPAAVPGAPAAVPGTVPGAARAAGAPGRSAAIPRLPGPPAGVPRTIPARVPVLLVGPAQPAGPLRVGEPGEIGVPIRNTGSGPAIDVIAVLSLPAGLTAVAGGADDPGGWTCTGSAAVATCRLPALPAGAAGTVPVKVRVALTAGPGVVSGRVTAAGSVWRPIPSTMVQIELA
ncbi:MAG: hypothetical protein ACJ73E_14475, partial [Mycobacteriales bacterium]